MTPLSRDRTDDMRPRTVIFRARIYLTEDEITAAEGNIAQAVQNEVGSAGADVVEIESTMGDE